MERESEDQKEWEGPGKTRNSAITLQTTQVPGRSFALSTMITVWSVLGGPMGAWPVLRGTRSDFAEGSFRVPRPWIGAERNPIALCDEEL